MNKKDKSDIYDLLYQLGNIALEVNNSPCKFIDGRCEKDRLKHSIGRCCERCKYITDQGCIVKSLSCKLYLCYELTQSNPNLYVYLRALSDVARGVGINMDLCRRSKEDLLGDNYDKKTNEGTK